MVCMKTDQIKLGFVNLLYAADFDFSAAYTGLKYAAKLKKYGACVQFIKKLKLNEPEDEEIKISATELVKEIRSALIEIKQQKDQEKLENGEKERLEVHD